MSGRRTVTAVAVALVAALVSAVGAAFSQSPRPPVGARVSRAARRDPPACTMFVSPYGHRSSSGRSRILTTTLAAATTRAHPGSVVCLERGTYFTHSTIILRHSGSRPRPIYFRNYDGAAVIRYEGSSLSGGLLQTRSGQNWGGAHDIVIDGLTLDGRDAMGGGIFVTQGSHHVTIKNCVVVDTGATGIALNATDYVRVIHNLVYHTGYDQGWSSGISLWYGGQAPTYGGPTAWYDRASGFHNYIADNVISGSFDNSDHHSEGNGIVVDGSGSIPPALIFNNLTYENGGNGIAVGDNSGEIWVMNNTGYADGLDLRIAGGYASEFNVYRASDVHFVNNLAYGRRRRGRYRTAYLYANSVSQIAWAHNVGFAGSTIGVAGSTIHNARRYRYVNPRFTRLPVIPSTNTPWASAPPPWSIGGDFVPAAHSPVLHAGVDPADVAGMTRALASELLRYSQ